MPSPQPTNRPRASAPTAKQLRFLRTLAQTSGTTFVYPATKAQASREIDRLLNGLIEAPGPRFDAEAQREIDYELGGPENAAAVREDEVTGYGADARWVHTREREDRS